jgi:hypothetical protein
MFNREAAMHKYQLLSPIIAIDPGANGAAVAFLPEGEIRTLPFGGQGNCPEFIGSVVASFLSEEPKAFVYLENVHAISGRANRATVDFVGGAIAIQAIVHSLGMDLVLVDPTAWTGAIKKPFVPGGAKARGWKAASRKIANAYLSGLGCSTLAEKTDPCYGVSEAVLIGIYGGLKDGAIAVRREVGAA